MGDIGPTQQRYEVLPSGDPVVVVPVVVVPVVVVPVVVVPVVEPAVEHEPEPRVRTSR